MQRIGETKAAKKLLKSLALKPSELALLDAAHEITIQPDAVERAYMARELVQCTLPHRDPGPDLPFWTRQNGNTRLALQPGPDIESGKLLGYPYGTIPRLVLFWVISEAVRRKHLPLKEARRIPLDGTLSTFMREVGLDPSRGGKRSDAHRLREQMDRLFSCRIAFQEVTPRTRIDGAKSRPRGFMEVAPQSQLWWDPKVPNQAALFGSFVELGEKFYESVTAAPVPLDLRALRALRRSPLALDLYAWACHKAYTVNRSGQAQPLSWEALMQQIGTDYANVDEFARKARVTLRKVMAVWRKSDDGRSGLLLDFEKGGLRVRPGSALPVLPEPQNFAQLNIEDAIARRR